MKDASAGDTIRYLDPFKAVIILMEKYLPIFCLD